ncbi:SET and/or TPR 11 domain containing protein [Asbolus verrucosus]|uniref:SET and/or TPR 11 domain containing protein n=1 Tax=Asbolus verrucosus TaxID=1661398 RepID=A0A482VNA4_ASBVE|nr:SET and/or TPR 11 domain containing protein [Asbolus verrucosus]
MTSVTDADNPPTRMIDYLKTLKPNFSPSRYLTKFGSLKTNQDRVNFIYRDMKKLNFYPKYFKDSKDDGAAIASQKQGDVFFGKGYYHEAIIEYTRSIATAKSRGVLSRSYANRSACLFKINMFKECLVDIDRALANNYPDHLKRQLHERQSQATRLMRPSERFHEDTPCIPEPQRNPLIESASDAVRIEMNEKWGRHVIATREIKIGEVLSVERPFACTLLMERLIHCHHCLEFCYNPVPCEFCTLIVFCSEQCKAKAVISYHKYECAIYFSLIACGMHPVQMLALKVTLLAKEDFGLLSTLTVDLEEVYRSDRYREIHKLMAATNKQSVKSLYDKAEFAAWVFHFLDSCTMFFKRPNTRNKKDIFKEVLLLQLQICELNGLGILEVHYDFTKNVLQTFGVGLYSFSSLFNHACCPNVEGFQYGSTMVMKAMKTIKEGEQCCISYGMSYGNCPKELRQEVLRTKFFFKCECEACKFNWREWNATSQFRSPLFMDLKMNPMEIMFMETELARGNMVSVHQFLARLLPQLKRCENFEPWGNALKIKRLVELCYRLLANRRRV